MEGYAPFETDINLPLSLGHLPRGNLRSPALSNRVCLPRRSMNQYQLSFSLPNISALDSMSPDTPYVPPCAGHTVDEFSDTDSVLYAPLSDDDFELGSTASVEITTRNPIEDISEDNAENPLFDLVRQKSSPSVISSESDSPVSTESISSAEPFDRVVTAKTCEVLPDSPYKLFNLQNLDDACEFTSVFRSRDTDFYGDVSYPYSGTTHQPKPFTANPYLILVQSYLKIVLPGYNYNSALIQRYADGNSHIPPHSDDENCIVDGSDIVTISLGANRHMLFQSKTDDNFIDYQLLQHGDVMVMSKESQSYYKHSIPVDDTATGLRISITFRLLKTAENKTATRTPHTPIHKKTKSAPAPKSSPSKSKSYKNHNTTRSSVEMNSNSCAQMRHSVIISSSMFRNIDENKLSSPDHRFTKLFYPGADAKRMKERLASDKCFKDIDKSSVTHVTLLTGSNNVDGVYHGDHGATLSQAKLDITSLVTFIRQNFRSAEVVNVLNILPREKRGRNDVIHELNSHIQKMCSNVPVLQFIDTYQNFMFMRSDGSRRGEFFKRNPRVFDDVHLNFKGVVRLGKFIKFLSYS